MVMDRTTTAPTRETREFHSIKEGYTERSLQDAIDRGWMTENDRDLILEYVEEKKGQRGRLSASRIKNIQIFLKNWTEFLQKPYTEITMRDVAAAAVKLANAKYDGTNTHCRKPIGALRYGKTGVHEHRRELKAFLYWLLEEGHNTNLDPKKLKKFDTLAPETMTFKASDLLLPDEIEAMIHACQYSRDRAIIALLYEGGLRPVEIGRLTWRDIVFHKHGADITVREKTDRPRQIPIRWAVPYVAAWRQDCPYIPEGDALMFSTLVPRRLNGELRYLPLKDNSLRKQLKAIAAKAGVKRYKKPYQLRHTRITDLLNANIPESHVMQISHGGRTTMFSRYAHVTDSDAKLSILKLQGVDVEELKKRPSLEARQCPRCNRINPRDVEWCGGCGRPLTLEAATGVEDLVSRLTQLPAEDPVAAQEIFRAMNREDFRAMIREEMARMRDEVHL
jgi:integrase